MSVLRKTIKVPIYCGNLNFILCDNMDEVKVEFDLNGDPKEWKALAFWKETSTGGRDYFMVFTPDVRLSEVVHESVHIVNMVFKYHYVELDLDNDETQAYFTGWIFDQCYKFLNKKLNERKRDSESIAF